MFSYANAMLDAKVVDFLTAKVIETLNNQFILVLYYYLDIYTVYNYTSVV